jgi:hypothetical protein
MEIKTPAPSALAAVKAGPPAEPIDKTRRIPEKLRRALDLLATGKCKTQLEAAEQVGLTRETLCRNLAKPHVAEYIRRRAIRTVAIAAGRAAEVKAEHLDCPDSMVRDRSSSFVLATAGIGPATAPSLSINLEMRAGYVIDLSATAIASESPPPHRQTTTRSSSTMSDDPRPGADIGMRIISPTVYSPPHRCGCRPGQR